MRVIYSWNWSHIRIFHARVVQHECDHLIGRLYPTRMRDLTRFGFTDLLFPALAGKE